MTNERRKSDKPVLPMKSSNKTGPPVAEKMEGRGLTKGKPQQQNASRTPSRSDAPSALERIRQAAKKDNVSRNVISGAEGKMGKNCGIISLQLLQGGNPTRTRS